METRFQRVVRAGLELILLPQPPKWSQVCAAIITLRKDTGWHGSMAQLPRHINANSLSSRQHRNAAAWLGPVPGVVTPGTGDLVDEKSATVTQASTAQGGNHVISSGDTEKAAQKYKTVSCLKYIQQEKKKSRQQQEGHLCHLATTGTDSPVPHGSGKVDWDWG